MTIEQDKALEHPAFRVTTDTGTGEIVEKKSRFIASVWPVKDVSEAEARLQETRKRYWDARHNCYAFVTGVRGELSRSSDDGEPSGTAGKPILAVLNGAGVTDTLIVVTRYFGGTLLGTGGLVRAYTRAAQAGLDAAPRAEMVYGQKLTVSVDYSLVNGLQRYFRDHDINPEDSRYTTDVQFDIRIITDDIEMVRSGLIALCEGKVQITGGEEGYFRRNVGPS